MMPKTLQHWFRFAVLAAALSFSLAALNTVAAVGLGSAEVRSYLNQPLDVRVPLTGLRSGEMQTLRIGLADAAAFERAGIDYAALPRDLKFELRSSGARGGFVQIRSKRAVREPNVALVLELRGREAILQRSYDLLLNLK